VLGVRHILAAADRRYIRVREPCRPPQLGERDDLYAREDLPLEHSLIDGYHSWLYGEALVRANDLERLTAAYYDSFGRLAGDADADADRDLRIRLESHVFGLAELDPPLRPLASSALVMLALAPGSIKKCELTRTVRSSNQQSDHGTSEREVGPSTMSVAACASGAT